MISIRWWGWHSPRRCPEFYQSALPPLPTLTFLNFSWKHQQKIHAQSWLCTESCPAVLLWHDSRIVSQASQHAKYSSHSIMLTHFIASSGTNLFFSVLHCGVCIMLYLHALENSPPVYYPWEPLMVLTRSLESSSLLSAIFIFSIS